MSRAMKDSGIEWIGQIPKEWKLVPTKRLFSCKKQIAGENAVDYERLALTMQGVIKRDKEDNEGLQPEKFDGYQILKRNEIVFKLIDLANVKTSRVGLSPYLGIVSPAYIIIRNNSEDNRYFYYWFMFMYHHNIFNQMGDDGVRSSLNADDVLKIPIANISLSEQQKIANYLDKVCGEVDEMIALQEQMIEELKAYKQSVITEAVTRGLNPNVKFKDSGIDWIGKIPQGWEVCRLKNVVKKRNQKADDTTLQYIGLEHLVGFSEEMVETENVYDKEGSNMCFPDDVIFGKLRPYLGKVKVIHEQCCCSAEFLVLQGASVPAYVRYLMLSDWFIEIVNSSTYGAKMPRANADFILNMNVCFPSNIDQQRQISDHLDTKCTEIDSLIAIKQQKIEELKDYKKSVIYEYVTGKKEVNG